MMKHSKQGGGGELPSPFGEEPSTIYALKNRDATQEYIPTKTFAFGELKKGDGAPPYSGDCHQIEGTLILQVLQGEGRAHFSCVTWTDSTHSGDYWWAGFLFQDHSGIALHNEPFHKGPRMDDGHPSPRYRWSFDFIFNAAIFDQITQVVQSWKC